LAAVHAAASLILRRLGPHESHRRDLELIQRSAGRMNRLIEDLLDAASIDARRITITKRLLAPAELLADAVEAERPLAVRKGLTLTADVSGALPRIVGDRDRLLQVFENLLGNAIRLTPAQGKGVACAAAEGSQVRFSVSDTGPGLAAADLERVFDRFWRARRSGGFGVGLGLSIAKGIVEAHGGRIWATSVPGAGGTFSFTVPGEANARDAA